MIQPSDDCRVLVLQNGARHDYAVPLALSKAGMLAGFYTDACGNQGLGRWLSNLSSIPWLGRSLNLLKNRRVPDSVLPITKSFPLASIANEFLESDPYSIRTSRSRFLGVLMEQAGYCGADMIYSSMGWSPHFLIQARARGLTIVTEFYVRPSLWRTHQEEYLKFPDWEAKLPYPECAENESARRGPCDLSDYLLAPTQAVKDDIVREGLFSPERIHVIPYCIGDSFFEVENRPVEGTVLYVGSCTLVKGIHYLATAARLVSKNGAGIRARFVAAGDVTDLVRNRPECSELNFLGRVPRSEIDALYATADVLVFPTLSDSFGMAILEAMAAGIPVICSPYCADAVEDGISGFVVDPRDPKALAHAISRIINDRGLRAQLSQRARERARHYGWENYDKELTSTLKSISTASD